MKAIPSGGLPPRAEPAGRRQRGRCFQLQVVQKRPQKSILAPGGATFDFKSREVPAYDKIVTVKVVPDIQKKRYRSPKVGFFVPKFKFLRPEIPDLVFTDFGNRYSTI